MSLLRYRRVYPAGIQIYTQRCNMNHLKALSRSLRGKVKKSNRWQAITSSARIG
jgi:hypothetical protein